MRPSKLLLLKITISLTGVALFTLPNLLLAAGKDPGQLTANTSQKISSLVQSTTKPTEKALSSSTQNPTSKTAKPETTQTMTTKQSIAPSAISSTVPVEVSQTAASSSTATTDPATNGSTTPAATTESTQVQATTPESTAAENSAAASTESTTAATTPAGSSSEEAAPAATETTATQETTEAAPAQTTVETTSYSAVPETSTAVQTPAPAPEAPKTDQLKILNQSISYQNGGQSQGQAIIDQDHSIVSTWGGIPAQSGNDNQNTHFIGHNPGIFSVLFSLHIGDVITATDSQGQPTDYKIYSIVQVDDSGYDIHDGHDYWDQITGTSGGERITLQTCIDDSTNLVVFANH